MTRLQRWLFFMAASIFIFGVAAIFAILIGDLVTHTAVARSTGLWASVAFVPLIAIPLAFILFIVLVVITNVQRGRSAEGVGK